MKRGFIIVLLLFLVCFAFAQNAKQLVKTALIDIENGHYEQALIKFNQAVQIEPRDKDVYIYRAECYIALFDTLSAAKDFSFAASLGNKPAINYYKAAKNYFAINKKTEARETAIKSTEVQRKENQAWVVLLQLYLQKSEKEKALETADIVMKENDDGISFYHAGIIYKTYDKKDKARIAFEKAIIKNENLIPAYLHLARMQIDNKEYKYAIDNCTFVLSRDTYNHEASYLRSIAHHNLRQPDKAINDITKTISLKSDPDYFLIRGKYYSEYGKFSNAIQDFSVVIAQNEDYGQAYYLRAKAHEQMGNRKQAVTDYQYLETNPQLINNDSTILSQVSDKIFELNFEENKPGIHVYRPELTKNLEIPIISGTKSFDISGVIIDENIISSVAINNKNISYDSDSIGHASFQTRINTDVSPFITITATDIYGNSSSVTHAIVSIEKTPPTIQLVSPNSDAENFIYVSKGDKFLYIEGYVSDNSKIKRIQVDKTIASFKLDEFNPRFTATVDVSGKSSLSITAEDEYGNKKRQNYYLLRGELKSDSKEPMGKTWAVIIENSEYKNYSNLIAPPNDAKKLKDVLAYYQINHIIHKRNLTKRELERFFAIDLRNLVKSNGVKSLLIYYTGHGVYQNETGYWIPVDAAIDDEFANYNVNALKASLYSYNSLKHLLVLIDACDAGPSFNVAMKGPISLYSCADTSLINHKSFQAFTSANEGYALDNSHFTNLFVETLTDHEFGCLSIDAIAANVIHKMKTKSVQEPVFGRIVGLKDEKGTFFFFRK